MLLSRPLDVEDLPVPESGYVMYELSSDWPLFIG